jgi:integral membrane protein
MSGALTRYRVAAYVVGVMLLVLVLVAMPMKYLGDNATPVAVIGPIHGWLFAIYLVITFDLARRTSWPLRRTLGVMVAGTIPFLSFVVERKVVRWMRAEAGTSTAAAPSTPAVPAPAPAAPAPAPAEKITSSSAN